MSQNNAIILYVGLDVAKASLQLDLAGTPHTLTHDAKGHARLLKLLTAHSGTQVICEATGGYEKPVVRALHRAQSPVTVVEAGRVRHFAKAKGLRAKTDLIDAVVLSEYGRTFKPDATPTPPPHNPAWPNCPPGGSNSSTPSPAKPTAPNTTRKVSVCVKAVGW